MIRALWARLTGKAADLPKVTYNPDRDPMVRNFKYQRRQAERHQHGSVGSPVARAHFRLAVEAVGRNDTSGMKLAVGRHLQLDVAPIRQPQLAKRLSDPRLGHRHLLHPEAGAQATRIETHGVDRRGHGDPLARLRGLAGEAVGQGLDGAVLLDQNCRAVEAPGRGGGCGQRHHRLRAGGR